MAHDALAAHARDELRISEMTRARPLQAAMASAAAFAAGAAPPLVLSAVAPTPMLSAAVAASSLVLLALLGGSAAALGGAPVRAGAVRVVVWGAAAMGATAAVGKLFGAVV
jgi:VIT1/CCC1 family predicted Fe2+/Mn2+ transporter